MNPALHVLIKDLVLDQKVTVILDSGSVITGEVESDLYEGCLSICINRSERIFWYIPFDKIAAISVSWKPDHQEE